jgi:hypothetical protein
MVRGFLRQSYATNIQINQPTNDQAMIINPIATTAPQA